MKTSCDTRSSRFRSTAVVTGVVALLTIAPAAWAAPGPSPGPVQSGELTVGSWLGGWVDTLLSGIESVWEAAAGPGGASRESSILAVETQEGPICEPTTTEQGCGMDPDG